MTIHLSVVIFLLYAAPTPPTEVSVEQNTPITIHVTWRKPSVSYSRIVYFTVYATPFNNEPVHIPKAKPQATILLTVAKVSSAISLTRNAGNLNSCHINAHLAG